MELDIEINGESGGGHKLLVKLNFNGRSYEGDNRKETYVNWYSISRIWLRTDFGERLIQPMNGKHWDAIVEAVQNELDQEDEYSELD